MTPGRVAWGFTQVPVSDEVIDLFERLELMYREHGGVRYGCASCAGSECGTTGITGGLTEA